MSVLDSVLPPSLIVTDISMPNLDGLSFARQLLRNQEWCRVPVIVVTAEPTRDLVSLTLRQMEVPPEAFLVKLIEGALLAKTVASVLERERPVYALRALQRERQARLLEVDERLTAERSAQATIKASQALPRQARRRPQGAAGSAEDAQHVSEERRIDDLRGRDHADVRRVGLVGRRTRSRTTSGRSSPSRKNGARCTREAIHRLSAVAAN